MTEEGKNEKERRVMRMRRGKEANKEMREGNEERRGGKE